MARRTVNLPDSVEALVREAADPGESFSATVSRLIEAGAREHFRATRPRDGHWRLVIKEQQFADATK